MDDNDSPVDHDFERNPIQYKKDRLCGHITFINQMINKFKGNDAKFEAKWQIMYDCILSDKKKMTLIQIDKLDNTISQAQTAERSKAENESKIQATPNVKVPKPVDLGQPVLSSDDLQELIQDLSGPEASTNLPPLKVAKQPEPKPTLKRLPMKLVRKSPPIVRLPSSWVPSKTTPPRNPPQKGITSPTLPFLAGQSLLKGTFKIPKLQKTPSSSSTSPAHALQSIPPSDELAKKPEAAKFTSFDIFQSVHDKNQHEKLIRPKRCDESSKKALDKTVVQSPSVDKKPEVLFVQKSSDDPDVKVALKKENEVPPTNPKASPEKDDSMSSNKSEEDQEMHDSSEEHKSKETIKVIRAKKELKRLHENIVKDEVPLSSRRSCTLKRTSAYCDSPTTTDGSADDQEKQIAKRSKNETTPAPEEIVEGPRLRGKTIASKKSLPAAEKSLIAPEKPVPAATRKGRSSLPVEVEKTTEVVAVPAVRRTRHSMQTQVDNKVEEPPNKKIKNDPPVQVLRKIAKDFDLVPCSIDLPSVTHEDLKKMPTKRNQIAKKSTNQRVDMLTMLAKQSALIPNKKAFKKRRVPPRKQAAKETVNDDEWEDVDEDASSSNGTDEKSESHSSPREEEIKPAPAAFIYQSICNLAFTHTRSGAIYKCIVKGCKYQTLQKHTFVKHMEERHKTVKWNGYCNICQKNVLPSKVGHSIINEFIHMMEGHLLSDKPPKAVLCEASDEPEHDTASEKSSTPEIDPEVMKGIDSILKELLPADTGNEIAEEKKQTKKIVRPLPKSMLPPIISMKQTSTLISPGSTPIVTSPDQTKIILKNIVGRVIPFPKISSFAPNVLANPVKIKLSPALLQAKKAQVNAVKSDNVALQKAPVESTISNDKSSVVPSKPEVTLAKYEKAEPQTIKISQQNHSLKPLAEDKIVKHVIKKPSAPDLKLVDSLEAEMKTTFIPLGPTTFTNISVTKDEPPANPQEEALRFHEVLRPWLKTRTKKNLQTANLMLSPIALTAQFKCLGTSCSFYTSEGEIFRKHLLFHNKFTNIDSSNFMSCAYCHFTCQGTPEALINHIVQEHGFDRFQCHYCFYRSCVDFNVLTHQNNYHKMKPRAILQIEVNVTRDYNRELKAVKQRRVEVVPPMVCLFCRAVFYVFKTFLNHINEHKNILNAKCTKCQKNTTKTTLHRHMTQCYGFGLFQCVYCRYGTNTFEIISAHIAKDHPSRLPLFCERSEYKMPFVDLNHALPSPPPQSSIESTCLKHINQKLNPAFLRAAPKDDVKLRNFASIGQLGSNIHIRGFIENKVTLPTPQPSRPKIQVIKTKDLMEKPRVPINSGDSSLTKPQFESEFISPKPAKATFRFISEKPQVIRRISTPVVDASKAIVLPIEPKATPTVSRQYQSRQPCYVRRLLAPKVPPIVIANPNPKPIGIQIQNVFSLSDSIGSITVDSSKSVDKV